MVPISILDTCPVTAGATASAALQSSIDLAITAERCGYSRYWLAEHHNLTTFACMAPDVLIGQIARATHRIRVGAGGVMLRNHAPLQVAERFAMLEALFPGRIDLGVGRGLGTDPRTAEALRSPTRNRTDDFEAAVHTLGMLARPCATGTSDARLSRNADLPPLWILGSGTESADVAARAGLCFAFAQHLSKRPADEIIRSYKKAFRPSQHQQEPYAILAVHAIAGETDREAQSLATSARLYYALRRSDDYAPLLQPDDASRRLVELGFRPKGDDVDCPVLAGDPETLARRLDNQIGTAAADELMILCVVADPAARRQSHTMIAEALRQA
jgi:luciferase family oxidoreductase group 1